MKPYQALASATVELAVKDYKMDPYRKLANGIVIQAAMDYREARRLLQKNPDDAKMLKQKRSAEQFFRSQWCVFLTPADGRLILKKLEEEEI